MAIFGAPKSHGNDAYHAVRTALRMICERDSLNKTSKHHLEIGIGIATGEVVAGCMGSADRLNYTVLGERVNLASRLCSKAGRMEILIDQNCREKLGKLVSVEPSQTMDLKGFREPVPTFKLLAVHSLKNEAVAEKI